MDVVTCGFPVEASRIFISDPDSPGRKLAEGQVGEVNQCGPHVSPGYWGDLGVSGRTAALPDPKEDPDRCIRTGDLGFIVEGEVFS